MLGPGMVRACPESPRSEPLEAPREDDSPLRDTGAALRRAPRGGWGRRR
jgi:hypothetical protein